MHTNHPVHAYQYPYLWSLTHSCLIVIPSGDIYITRHSNLCQVHTVFHLVTDESVIMNSSLKNRHPIFAGLKSCLRVATRHDIYHVTIPLLLVHSMQPVSRCTTPQ